MRDKQMALELVDQLSKSQQVKLLMMMQAIKALAKEDPLLWGLAMTLISIEAEEA